MKQTSSYIVKSTLLVVLLYAIASFVGCRQEPANKVKYYEAELQEMKAAKRNQAASQQQLYIKDGYPWQGKKKHSEALPCRINRKRSHIQYELDYLDEAIHGKKKIKLKLRD